MSNPFEYFDPAVAARNHGSKVEISPSPPPSNSGPSSSQAKSPPYQMPPTADPAYPYHPAAAVSHQPSGQHYVPPQPSKSPQPGHSPYQQPPPSAAQKPYQVPSQQKPVQAPVPKPSGNPYAIQQQQAAAARGNPYALPPQPSAPQGGFQGGHSKVGAPVAKPVAAGPPKGPYSAPVSGASYAAPPPSQAAPQHAPRPYRYPDGPELFLSESDRAQFLDCGFVSLPNVVSKDLRNRALQSINKSLERIPITNRTTTSCPELVSADPLLDLFYASGCASLASRLIGTGFHPPPHCFISLQYPGDGCIDEQQPNDQEGWHMLPEKNDLTPAPHWQSYWKIDGLPAPATGPNDDHHFVRNYSLLVGVYLNDIPEEMAGNITLWPGSHLGIQSMLRARGGTVAALKAGKIDRPVIQNNTLESVPQQLTAKAGDVILCHYQVAHTFAPNLSSDIRYMVFFRVYSKQHTPNTMRPEAMDNIFLDFEGVYDLIGKSHPK